MDWDEQLVLLSMSVLFIIILTTITMVSHDRHTLMFIELMTTSFDLSGCLPPVKAVEFFIDCMANHFTLG